MDTHSTVNTEFNWSPFDESRWRELAEAAGCSELQLRFGVARFQGASQTAAARLAGYGGDAEMLRRAGYTAARSTGVANLLELAAVNAPATAAISDTEIAAKIAKLIRSSDSNVSIKAMELHAKRQAAQAAEQAAANSEPKTTMAEVESVIICATPCSGYGAAFLIGHRYNEDPVGRIAWFPFLEEVAPLVSRKFPDDWQLWRAASDKRGLEKELAFIDHCANGKLLVGDELIAAVKDRAEKGFKGPFDTVEKVSVA